MSWERVALVPRGDPPESSMVAALRSLNWRVADVLDVDVPDEPSLVIEPEGLDVVIDVAFAPGYPTVMIFSGDDARSARSMVAEAMPHHEIDDLIDGYRQSESPVETMAWLQLLASASLGEADAPAVVDVVIHALDNPAPEVRHAALAMAGTSIETYQALIERHTTDPDGATAALAHEILRGDFP